MTEVNELDELTADLRTGWDRYVDSLVPLRPALFGYCRRLTGSVWDAEDLVQDTLLRAFAQWGMTEPPIRHPMGFLLRVATRIWIDLQRRRQTETRNPARVHEETRPASGSPATSSEVRDAGARLLQELPPQERAALVLKEVFDMTLEEIAEVLVTTVGAVKAALHRGRGRLAKPQAPSGSRRPAAVPDVIDRFVERFSARDLPGLVELMLESGSMENIGYASNIGADPERGTPRFLSTLMHGHEDWPEGLRFGGLRAERLEFEGEPIIGFFVSNAEKEALMIAMRIDEVEGRISRIRSYGFCPETMRAIGEAIDLPVWTGIYRPPTPVGEAGR